MMHVQIAFKSILSRRKQYRLLFVVCIVGFCVSLLCLSLMNGMLSSLHKKAKIYFGGNLQFLGGTSGGKLGIYDSEEVLKKLESVFSDEYITICPRYEILATDVTLFFEGIGVNQRVIKGVNFDIEKKSLEQLTFKDGGIDSICAENSILISEPIAQTLHVNTGDRITMMKPTRDGFQNTTQFVVAGIFKDSSLFGMYTSYVDLDHFLKLENEKPKQTNRIGILFDDDFKLTNKIIQEYQKKLELVFDTMYPLTDDKEKFYNYRETVESNLETFALITLDANFEDLNLLISAMKLLLYSIIIVLALIIAIGIGNSYKVIVFKRIREIGMFRALGMSVVSIRFIFLSEALLVLLSGFTIGLVVQYIIAGVLASIDFSFIPAFDVFLQNGSLVPSLSLIQAISLFSAIAVTTLVSVLFTIRKGVTVNPVDALSTNE